MLLELSHAIGATPRLDCVIRSHNTQDLRLDDVELDGVVAVRGGLYCLF